MVWQELSGIYYILYKGRFKIYGDMHDRREVCSIRKTKRAYGIVYPMMLKGDLVSCRLQYGDEAMMKKSKAILKQTGAGIFVYSVLGLLGALLTIEKIVIETLLL